MTKSNLQHKRACRKAPKSNGLRTFFECFVNKTCDVALFEDLSPSKCSKNIRNSSMNNLITKTLFLASWHLGVFLF